GETKEFKIISIEPESHRLGLSMKALEEDAAPKTADGERVSDPALAGISLGEEPKAETPSTEPESNQDSDSKISK
ncbi:MAG: hypothetical protein HY092_04020, partial [Candidatus Kerfeldbacteria bacterium]|nr:hypothetical protein [Candidatus Kerfeldbacteria bacterium]